VRQIQPIFTPEERSQLRYDLLEYAGADSRISAGAITGSATTGREDRWSDIDLAFGVIDAIELPPVLSGYTALMYDRHRALHHHDVKAGAWIYRVFFLSSTLQVDLAFVPVSEFRALAPSFQLVFGQENEPRHAPPQLAADIVGFGWLYALHTRSCIARRKLWQAEYMLSGVRDYALALACIRHGLPSVHGRGLDHLPHGVIDQFEGSLVRQLDVAELTRAFRVALRGLLNEIQSVDANLATRLQLPLITLVEIEC
jgi:hypothetical protein